MPEIRVVQSHIDDADPTYIWARVAALVGNDAWSAAGRIQTTNIKQYVIDNEQQVYNYIVNNGALDEELTKLLRMIQAKRLLKSSPLEGRTPEEVQAYVESQITSMATARDVVGDIAYQVALIYQVLGLTLEAVD